MKFCSSLVIACFLLAECKNPMSQSEVKDTATSPTQPKNGFDMDNAPQTCVPVTGAYKPCATDTAEQRAKVSRFAASCVDAGFEVIRCTPAANAACGTTICSLSLRDIKYQTGYDIDGKQRSCVPYKGPKLLCEPVPAPYIKRLTDFKAACTNAGFDVIGCVDAPDGRCGGVACSGNIPAQPIPNQQD